MKISVAMATYNGAKYIQAQLKSIADQTMQPDELVITDDCSTDETESIICEFAMTAPFSVKYFRNSKNLGYCGNFNEALMKTTGDLVFLSDQDDVWFPDKIEYMAAISERNPEILVIMNNAALTDENLTEVGLTKIGQIQSAGLSMQSFVMGCCCAVRRDLLDICLPIPQGLISHDEWIVKLAEGLGQKLIDNHVLQFYRRHDKNTSQFIVNSTKKITRTYAIYARLKQVFTEDTEPRGQELIIQLQIYSSGIREVLSKAPERYQESLEALLKNAEATTRSLAKRIKIRGKWLIPRIAAILSLAVKGGYHNAGGTKAALRDIIG